MGNRAQNQWWLSGEIGPSMRSAAKTVSLLSIQHERGAVDRESSTVLVHVQDDTGSFSRNIANRVPIAPRSSSSLNPIITEDTCCVLSGEIGPTMRSTAETVSLLSIQYQRGNLHTQEDLSIAPRSSSATSLLL